MGDTQVLLGKIAALKERLEQVRRLTDTSRPAQAPATAEASAPTRLRQLEHHVETGGRHTNLIEGALRQMAGAAAQLSPLPTQLTARARRLIERGRDLLGNLRTLGDEPLLHAEETRPLAVLYRETVAMTEASLRIVQNFPDTAGDQLRLCDGLEAILAVIAERVTTLSDGVARDRREESRIDMLADLLAGLNAGRATDPRPFQTLAETVLRDAQEGAPLRFFDAGVEDAARHVACHALTVAQVMARLIRYDTDFSGPPTEPILAALVHDVGMLSIAAEAWTHPAPLDDAQRREVERHTRAGAELAAGLLPNAGWLAEAAVGHHERLDGTGYPAGLREAQISSLNRLLAVCDVYAAQCAPRQHRAEKETRTALADTLLLAEKGLLDRQHAESLLLLSFYPAGSVVELADGAVGMVVAVHAARRAVNLPARPVLALLTDTQGNLLPTPRHLDLAQCEGRSIVRSLAPDERRQLLGKRYPECA